MREEAGRELPFYKLSPGGNSTVFLPLAAVPPAGRAAVSRTVMDPLHLGAEQVGFVDLNPEAPQLVMMGGEFCGNACRALAALLAMRQAGEANSLSGRLRSSGSAEPVLWRADPGVEPGLAAAVAVRVDLGAAWPQPVRPGLLRADLPGMCILLFDESRYPLPPDPVAEAAQWRAELGLAQCEGVGCVRHAPLGEAGPQHIVPMIWVRETGSSCLETACGSASLALALAAHGLAKAEPKLDIRQPSGATLRVELEEKASGGFYGWIGGPVRLVAQGRTWV